MTQLPAVVTFYSIGENCLGHGVLRRHGVKIHATPFSHARSNIDYVRQMVSTDFADMLNPDLLRYDDRYNARICINPLYTCDTDLFEASARSSFEFTHHDVIAKPEAADRYRRMASRLLQPPAADIPVCFVYHHRRHNNRNLGKIAGKLDAFRNYWSGRFMRPASIAMFTQDVVSSEDERGVSFKIFSNVPVAIIRTRKHWGGTDMDQFWGRADDDLFAKMIGAFELHALAMHQQKATLRRPSWSIRKLLSKALARG